MNRRTKVHKSTSTLRGDDYEIPVEHYEPDLPGALPTVLVIHGAYGLSFRADQYRDICQGLCERGMSAALPRYFDATRTQTSDHESTMRHFKKWREVLKDALLHVATRATVDPERMGLFGVSLGSILAISLAGSWQEPSPRLKAVVEHSGQLPKRYVDASHTLDWLSHCPPVLIIHGEDDRTIPVQEAFTLAAALSQLSIEHEVQIYPQEGHRFEGPAGADALKRSLAFLQKHL